MNKERGFSLAEILLVLAGVGFLIILLATFPNSVKLITWSRNQSMAKEIAAQEIEKVREQSYINLAPGTQTLDETDDLRIGLLPAGGGERIIEDCDPAICTQSELVKMVTVTISWNEEGNIRQARLVTFISEGGLNQ